MEGSVSLNNGNSEPLPVQFLFFLFLKKLLFQTELIQLTLTDPGSTTNFLSHTLNFLYTPKEY